MKIAIATVVAGIIMFVWGFLSWTVLPWHKVDVHQFQDESLVMQTLTAQGPESGIYWVPGNEEDYTPETPGAFVNLLNEGYGTGMGQMMIGGLVCNLIFAFLTIMLLAKTSGMSYGGKVGFITMVGFLVALGSALPYWNWFGFPAGYSLVQIADVTIMWLLAGLAIAKLAPDG